MESTIRIYRTAEYKNEKAHGEISVDIVRDFEPIEDTATPERDCHHPSLLRFRAENPDLFLESNADSCSFEALGKIKLDTNTAAPQRMTASAEVEKVELPANYATKKPCDQIHMVAGEEKWQTDDSFTSGVIDIIKEKRRVFIQGHAGHGKSHYAKATIDRMREDDPTSKHLVVNFCGSLVGDVWAGFNAMTVDRALGQRVTDEGEIEAHRAGENFAEYNLLVVDEAYCVSFENLFRLNDRVERENPKMIVIYLGCPYQNELICDPGGGKSVFVKPVVARQNEIFRRIAPDSIVLRVNKRSPKDQPKLEEIWRMLFVERMATADVVNTILERKWVAPVQSFGEIARLGLDQHICFRNAKSVALAKRIHTEMFHQHLDHEVCDGSWFMKRNAFGCAISTRCRVSINNSGSLTIELPGRTLVKTAAEVAAEIGLPSDSALSIEVARDSLFQRVGIYLVRCHTKGLVRNTLARVIGISKRGYELLPFSGKISDEDEDAKPVREKSINFETFRLPYCRTGHSTQGITLNRPYVIHDANYPNLSANWLWTAITRSTTLSDVHFFTGDRQSSDITTHHVQNFVAQKLQSYKESDAAKGWSAQEAYSVDGMVAMAKASVGKRCCGVLGDTCDNIMTLDKNSDEAASFDRIDNSIGHRLDNLRCICFSCNRRAKQHDEKVR